MSRARQVSALWVPRVAGTPADRAALAHYTAEQRADAACEFVDPDDAEPREMGLELVAFRRLCAHFFSAGPQPEEVLQRVFAAAADRRADLLRGLDPREVQLAREESARGRRWRIAALFHGGSADWRRRYRVIVSTLRAAHTSAHSPAVERITLREALALGRNGTEPPEATETLSRTLERVFSAGNDPRAVVQYTFALTGWLFRDLQLSMPLEALGRLFDEERATQSWRSIHFVGAMLRKAGCRGFKAGWQKREATVAKYRDSARGNKNAAKRKRSFEHLARRKRPASDQ